MNFRISLNKLAVFSVLLVVAFIIGCNDNNDIGPDTSGNNGEDTTTTINDDIVVNPDKKFNHPGLLQTQDDFDRIIEKLNAGKEPWVTGWDKLVANSHSSSGYAMQGPTIKLIRGGSSREEPEPDNYSKAFNDVAAAYQNAIRWKVSGDIAHAEKAIEILNAWASTCDTITGDPNYALAVGIYGYQFANAAEIMRDYNGWEADDLTHFKNWMVSVFYPHCSAFLKYHMNTCPTYIWANWDLCNVLTMMSIGVLADRVDIYSEAIDYLMNGVGNGQLVKTVNYIHEKGSNDDIDLGQLQESGRDQGHSLLCIGLLGDICETAYSQGEDLYGYKDHLILKAAEYSAKYNVANLSVPFHTYTNCNNETHTEVSPDGRGNERPIWEKLYSHYVIENGITARYVTMAARTVRPEGGGGDYGANSGGFDQLGFGTLLYSK